MNSAHWKILKSRGIKVLSLLLMASLFLPFKSYAGSGANIYAANRNAGKYVALTFDDGPHPVYTEKILEILKENNAHATFFVIGKNAEQYPFLLKRVHDEGHEIGNHTYSHPDLRCLTVEQSLEEIEHAQEVVKNITGEYPKLFRAPGGCFSDVLVGELDKMNFKSVLWSWRQDTKDWSLPEVDEIVKKVIGNIKDGDIILFHDYNSKGSPTPKAVSVIVPKLIEMGYSLVTVSELISINDDIMCDENGQ